MDVHQLPLIGNEKDRTELFLCRQSRALSCQQECAGFCFPAQQGIKSSTSLSEAPESTHLTL
ncbi:unnamed protein product [Staurois parvus]|uniref:Uncharacterized protein n=1 Tax=Staurois parvus TaxID=386267 RepID=A0ABN9GYE7_9NEOB|nr:unnamed protein product [Staurois parvus]